MKSRLRDHFSFTTSERNGTVALLILIGMLIAAMGITGKYYADHARPVTFSQQWFAPIDSVEKRAKSDTLQPEEQRRNSFADEVVPHSVFHRKELFRFNPNGLAEDEWIRLGLSPSQARVIKKYEAKGGKFFTKDDVKKMFVISAEKFAELEPYIVLPVKDPSSAPAAAPAAVPKKMPVIVELNTADTTDLMRVNGIGPVFARRIIAYREKLGGYYSTGQLREVFGIDAEKFEAIKNAVKSDSTYIRKMNINTALPSELKQHPYFSPALASALVNYRKQHGNFHSVDEIRNCALVNADLYRKIAPYLTI